MLLYQLMLKIIHVEGSCVICLFHCVMTRLDYMSNMTGVLYKAGAASHLQAPGFTQVVLVGSVFLIFLVFWPPFYRRTRKSSCPTSQSSICSYVSSSVQWRTSYPRCCCKYQYTSFHQGYSQRRGSWKCTLNR